MTVPVFEKPITAVSPSSRRQIFDLYRRPLQDLRISLIDRCNFRCTYCMPQQTAGSYSFLKEKEWLTFAEIERLVRLFTRLGVTKIRLTGGEPLLRPGLPQLIAQLRGIPAIEDLALTTNGSLLAKYADVLKKSGLDRITVSLDALDAGLFRKMSGQRGNVDCVLEGIAAAEQAGFDNIKINVVVQKNVNDRHILDLVRYLKGRQPILRFIEYMDVGNCNHWDAREVVSSIEVAELINRHFPIKPVKPNYFGEVAARYRFLDGSGEIGFISSITQPFCHSCTRMRLSADGKIYTCLFSAKGIPLQKWLRQNSSDDELLNILATIWQKRSDRYSEQRAELHAKTKNSPKIEMYQIGG